MIIIYILFGIICIFEYPTVCSPCRCLLGGRSVLLILAPGRLKGILFLCSFRLLIARRTACLRNRVCWNLNRKLLFSWKLGFCNFLAEGWILGNFLMNARGCGFRTLIADRLSLFRVDSYLWHCSSVFLKSKDLKFQITKTLDLSKQ